MERFGNLGDRLVAVVEGVTTCAELVRQVDFEALSADEASLVAQKMLAIATEQAADDGVIEEKTVCSRIIQNLDVDHADAVDGMDLEGLEQETKESLGSDD